MMQTRYEAVFRKERCCLGQGHRGNHKHHWINQEQLNQRLSACGYGGSIYPSNWWSEKELLQVERVMESIHRLEDAMEKRFSQQQIIDILVYWRNKKEYEVAL